MSSNIKHIISAVGSSILTLLVIFAWSHPILAGILFYYLIMVAFISFLKPWKGSDDCLIEIFWWGYIMMPIFLIPFYTFNSEARIDINKDLKEMFETFFPSKTIKFQNPFRFPFIFENKLVEEEK